MVKWKTRAAVLLKRQAEVLPLRPSPNHEVWYSGSTRSASLLFLLPFPYLSSCTCFTTRDFTHQVHIPLHFLTKGWLIFSLLFLLLCELERFFNAQLRDKLYNLCHLFGGHWFLFFDQQRNRSRIMTQYLLPDETKWRPLIFAFTNEERYFVD